MKLTIISGRSGSGKSVCLHALEDFGFYCIDNLPVSLLPALVEQVSRQQKRVAISIDARNMPSDHQEFLTIIEELKKIVSRYEIIFIDAEESVLLRRFSETRRKHPLSSDKIHLQEALEKESQLLEPLAQLADLRLDTTKMNVQELRELIRDRLNPSSNKGLSLLFESFGYKRGIPLDADFTFDVRCIPNPYWEPHLRSYNGLNPVVAEYLQKQNHTSKLINDIIKFLESWLPCYEVDNRNYMTIAIGCTGGQHRSVYVVEQLAKHFREKDCNVHVRHREI